MAETGKVVKPHGLIGCALLVGIMFLGAVGVGLRGEMNKRREVDRSRFDALGRRRVNLTDYCKSNYGNSAAAVNFASDAFSWRCVVDDARSSKQYFEISIDEACQRQYGAEFRAIADDPKNFESWRCIPK